MTRMMLLLAVCSLAAAPALAGTTKTHHCEMNGASVDQTKAECKKNGGKWMKGPPGADGAMGSTSPSEDSMRKNGSIESGYPPNENAASQPPARTLPVQNESNDKKAAATQRPGLAPAATAPVQNEGNDKTP